MAFILDTHNTVPDRINPEMVEFLRIDTENTEAYRVYLKALITEYVEKTNSPWGQEVLKNFSRHIANFWLVKSRAIEVEALFDLFANSAD